jgi:hypothetical protein
MSESGANARLSRVVAWMPAFACLAAVLLALIGPSAQAETTAPTYAGAPAASGTASATTLAPPDHAALPLEWMPPGANVSREPSLAVFPRQTMTIRFNHAKHVKGLKQSCKACHAEAYASTSASDRLLPDPIKTCDRCHDVDHTNRAAVKAGTDSGGQCSHCHLGGADRQGRVARFVIPNANLHFNHKKHLDRNIGCAQCHGQVGEIEQATRDQLPRMAGCLTCHDMSGAARGDAKSECSTCHLTNPDNTMKTRFGGETLEPPAWLHSAGHGADWLTRHKAVAANDSAFCGSCHTSSDCTNCHDGKVRPRDVHPNDWLSMHAQAARQDSPRCVSCHQLQTFCADCHRRVGVARDAPSGNRAIGMRFHPPPSEWTNAPRGRGHHAWEAERNLNACVSCHTERDCTTCHATRGLNGGQGVSPHPINFGSKCNLAFQRNPRSCLVCHQQDDRSLGRCR